MTKKEEQELKKCVFCGAATADFVGALYSSGGGKAGCYHFGCKYPSTRCCGYPSRMIPIPYADLGMEEPALLEQKGLAK